jgi:hypothetical protein
VAYSFYETIWFPGNHIMREQLCQDGFLETLRWSYVLDTWQL